MELRPFYRPFFTGRGLDLQVQVPTNGRDLFALLGSRLGRRAAQPEPEPAYACLTQLTQPLPSLGIHV